MLSELGMILNFKTIHWDDCGVPMRSFPTQAKSENELPEPPPVEQLFLNVIQSDLEDNDAKSNNDSENGDCHAILDNDLHKEDIEVSKCAAADIDKVVQLCAHLPQDQQNKSRDALAKCPIPFNNELGTCPDEQVHLDLKEDVVPHCQPCACAVSHNH